MTKRSELQSKEDLFRKINGFHSGYAAIKENARLYKQRTQENKPASGVMTQKTKIHEMLGLETINTGGTGHQKVELLNTETKNSRSKNKTPSHTEHLEKRNISPERKRFDLGFKKVYIQEDPHKAIQSAQKKPGSPPTEKATFSRERTVQTYRDKLNTFSDEKNQFLLSNSPSPSKNMNPFGTNIYNQTNHVLSIKSNPTSLKGSPRLDGLLTEYKSIKSHRNQEFDLNKKTPRLDKKPLPKSNGGKQRLATENLGGQNTSFSDSNVSRGKIKPLSLNMKNSLMEQKGNILADKILMSGSKSQKTKTASKEEIENHFINSKAFQLKSAMNSLTTFKSNRPDTSYQTVSSKTKINTERTSPAFGENKGSFFYHQDNICSLKSVTESSNHGTAFSILRDPTPDKLDSLYLRSSSLGDTERLTPVLNKRRLESDDLALDYVRRLTFKPTTDEDSTKPSKQKNPPSKNLELDSKTRFFAKKIIKNQNTKSPKRSVTPLGISSTPSNEKVRSSRPCSTSRSCRTSQDYRPKNTSSPIYDTTIFYQNQPKPSTDLKISSPDNNFSFNQLSDLTDSMGELKQKKDAKNLHFPHESDKIETNHITRPHKKTSPTKTPDATSPERHQDYQVNISSLDLQTKEKENNPNLETLFKLAEEKILQKINEDGLSPESATNQFLQEFQNQLASNSRLNPEQTFSLQISPPNPNPVIISPEKTPKKKKAQSNEYQNISRSLQFLGELEESDRLDILVAMSKDIDKIQDQEGYDSAIDLIREFLDMIQNQHHDTKNSNQWQSLEIDFCNKLGAYLYKKGDYDEALKELTKILQIDSANLPALYKIHEIHLKLGNRKEARLVLKQIRGNFQDSQSSAPPENNDASENRNDYINTILEVDESFDSSDSFN